ncbi:hypothetical protein [Rubritalea tangerina]|uniref:Uncharacterized protein n=1 Tax=Rubritalea tangerina TaxID=430798 RepID=A0ABW4ZBC6_9BACT
MKTLCLIIAGAGALALASCASTSGCSGKSKSCGTEKCCGKCSSGQCQCGTKR